MSIYDCIRFHRFYSTRLRSWTTGWYAALFNVYPECAWALCVAFRSSHKKQTYKAEQCFGNSHLLTIFRGYCFLFNGISPPDGVLIG